jgi:4-carboxymuconolactone decarboxylase
VLNVADFTPEQRRIALEISACFGGNLDGPFAVWIRIPEIAEKASRLTTLLRVHGKLERRLFELMVLTVARHYRAQFEWSAHEPMALKEGISEEIVEAIRTGGVPKFARPDERTVYGVVTEINETGGLSRKTYYRALRGFGQDLLIELVTATGLYSMVAIVLNVFEAPVPGGRRPRLS